MRLMKPTCDCWTRVYTYDKDKKQITAYNAKQQIGDHRARWQDEQIECQFCHARGLPELRD